LNDWGQRAKHLDRSLGVYTPAPSASSSLRVLVKPEYTVTSTPK